jgi:hypothetical protein
MHALTSLIRRLTRRITPAEMATRELAVAELQHLEAMSAADHARASVLYHETRINRLRAFLAKTNGTEAAGQDHGHPATNVGMNRTYTPSALYNLARQGD